MRALPAILLAATSLVLGGCTNLPGENGVLGKSGEFLSRSGEMISSQGARIADITGIRRDDSQADERQQELVELFEQPLIDPLTRYLQEHAGDEAYAAYLPGVAEERERRCGIIGQRFAAEAPTAQNLQRLERGYRFSCPEQIKAFAAKVDSARAESAAVDPAPPPQRPGSPAASSAAAPAAQSRRQASNCYLLFTIRNYQQAAQACEAPASAGDNRAQYNMARIARINDDNSAAYRWASLAAEQNNADAQLLLAHLYQQGQGVNTDNSAALTWLQRAANQNHPGALYGLAQAYQQGLGTAIDTEKALQYATAAAERDHQPAQLLLASYYDQSAQTQALSRQWLLKAAQQGSREGQYRLGESFERGLDGQPDPQQAYVWYSLALLNGEQKAKRKVEALSASLTPAQLQQAQASIQAQLKRR